MSELDNKNTEETVVREERIVPEIRLSELSRLVQEGKKKVDIMEYYNLKAAQVEKLMKQAKLTFRKFHKDAFVLVDDIKVEEEETTSAPSITSAAVLTESEKAENGSQSNWEI